MLELIGYADRFSAAPGETIEFKVSAFQSQRFRAEIVRLIHGDANPEGPGYKHEAVPSSIEGEYQGRNQPIRAGSFGVVPHHPAMAAPESFTLMAMVWPTMPARGRQAILALGDEVVLAIGENGGLAGRIGTTRLSSEAPLHERHWYLAALTFDAASGRATLIQRPLLAYPGGTDAALVEAEASKPDLAGAGLLIAAEGDPRRSHLDGKIDSPRLLARALPPERLEALLVSPLPADLAPDLVFAFDFARGTRTTRIHDTGPHRLEGRLEHLPARAMKGWCWSGEEMCWWRKPEHYGAIHFHSDDLLDAGWSTDFAFRVPDDLRSGVYAAHVWCGDAEDGTEEDLIPFFVRPPRGHRNRPKLAFLAPTAAYMAYANDQNHIKGEATEMVIGRLVTYQPADIFLYDHPELGLSLYDRHADGSGVCYSSRHRPILNMRPKYSSWLGATGSGLWQFNADLHITDWLESHMKVEFDVITDEDLHEEGLALLEPYDVVITGTHPEYHSTRMWDAMRAWIDKGGRLMYVAANGWYWRIAFHDELRGVIEVRRAEDGIRTWEADPGEYYHSFTGEYGGLWRRQGRPPQALLGIGFMAQGFDICSYYRRQPGSHDPRAAFVFEGVDDEIIGDFGLIGGGAAGLELDAIRHDLGTPPNTLVLASSEAHSDVIMLVNEEFGVVPPNLKGSEHPNVRADMTFFDTAAGGAVFATGSIAWCGSLSWNGYDNNVSRITGNVLRRFLDPTPFR